MAFKFRERIPVRDSDAFMEAIGQIDPSKLKTFVPVLCTLVESWDYPGEPSDPSAYDDLDLFRDFFPMVKAAEAYISAVAPDLTGNR